MAESTSGIAAVTILYHPDDDVLANLETTAAQVDRLWAIDNTEQADPSFGARIAAANVEFVPLGRNAGIASALNIGVEHCAAAGYEWVVTMDQDSTPAPDMVRRLRRCANACGEKPLGVVAPVHVIENAPASQVFDGCREELTVITSGDLVRIDAWRAIGGFDEALFIDQVDHDFCLRLGLAGYFVGTCGAASLAHKMGSMSRRRLLGPVYVSNHSPVRRYYITRNRLEMIRRYGDRYPKWAAEERRSQFHELLKLLIFETDRYKKLRMAWRGWRDYRRHRLGSIEPGPQSPRRDH